MLIPNRHGTSNSYRYGFNGKEKDDEIKGNGNSYDFGARMLDVRIGRWFSVDSKAAKFSFETTYGYVSNNPIIFKDPDGDEKIIVIGGGDKQGNDHAKFINSGLRKLNNLIKSSGREGITLLITDKYLREAYKKQIEKQIKTADSKYKGKVSVVYVNNGDELSHYMNSKSTKSEKLSEARKGDLISEVDFFGHGYRPDKSSQGPDTGSLEPAHYENGLESMDDLPSTRPDHNNWAWGKKDVDILNKNAFADDGTIDFSGICNASTPTEAEMTAGTNNNNLARYTATKLPGVKVKGWFGKVDYNFIYDAKGVKPISNPFASTIGPALSNPIAGSKVNLTKSESKTYLKKKT